MERQKALRIAKSIYMDIYGKWRIPSVPVSCEEKATLVMSGEEVTIRMKDIVPEWIDYVIKLIEGDVNNG